MLDFACWNQKAGGLSSTSPLFDIADAGHARNRALASI
jgi:hypothetical protein